MYPHPAFLLLEKGLAKLDLPFDDTVIDDTPVRGRSSLFPLLWKYLEEIVLFNANMDLVGSKTSTEEGKADLVVRHILDSIAPWKTIVKKIKESGLGLKDAFIADVGTGAGFPGIPLSLVFPYIKFSLIERMEKRCNFLENVLAVLKLSNVKIYNCSLQNFNEEKMDVVIFRAFKPLGMEILKNLFRIKNENGVLLAWKGKKDNITKELDVVSSAISSSEIIPIKLPFLETSERNLVLIK